MRRILIAFKALFGALFNASTAERIQLALESPALRKSDAAANLQRVPGTPPPAAPGRSEAITLLAALQREARFLDLVKQPLSGFSDEQIGAAARNVLADCGATLERFFALQPMTPGEEGSPCDVPGGYDAACYKLSGRVEGSGPFRGTLVHHGWKATAVKLPDWTGSKTAALVVAPAEVEI